ncbi:EAL domain-containing protein [Thioalkalivibrio sp. ALR17-21]|uniref:EAL domain-containing response regulator n=1 Tax=Thioalkalivibrio sp. ALR17-21 TaxID=1269813 RepID=UPI000414D3A3|nr:EAL domain-containing response regulator [Thioalkalivibrio sp. ALR17-21]
MTLSGVRTLILEDDPEFADELGEYLGALGASVVISHDLASLRRKYLSESFDLCLVDLQVGEEDGIAAIAYWAEREERRPKVVFISGLDLSIRESAEGVARDAGVPVLGHLAKPLVLDELGRLLEDGWDSVRETGRGGGRAVLDGAEIEDALADRLFAVAFQPQASLRDGRVKGVEALARIRMHYGEVVRPGAFLWALEDSRYAWPIFAQISDMAIARFGALQSSSRDVAPMTLSINLSLDLLGHGDLLRQLLTACRQNSVRPNQVLLEITERELEVEPVHRRVLTQARIAGFGLSLDDFGAGTANLDRLVRFPLTEVKVDRWFLEQAVQRRGGRRFLCRLAALGRDEGLETVIEGVSREELMDVACECGFGIAQGFYISEPLWPEELGTDRVAELGFSRGCSGRGWSSSREDRQGRILTDEEREFLRGLLDDGDAGSDRAGIRES